MIPPRRSTLFSVGIATMAVGILVVFSARVFREYRAPLEDWGARLFLVGLMIWGSAFPAI